jgi:hypothetical protein
MPFRMLQPKAGSRLGDGAGDVVVAAIFVLGDGDSGARKFSVDLGLQPRQKLNRLSRHVIRDPGILGEPAGPGSGAMVCLRSFRIGDEVNPGES